MQNIFSKRLKCAMDLRNIKPVDICEKTNIPKSAISQYLSGSFKPKQKRTYILSELLNVNPAWLMGYDVPMEQEKNAYNEPNITEEYTVFPIMGEVAAGYDHIAVEDWCGDTVDIPNSYLRGHKKTDFFVLRVIGNSMFPTYQENDKVLILKQNEVNYSGDVGVVIYDDELGTLKKVEYSQGENWVRLVPINTNIPPITLRDEELDHFKIIGIPKLLIREIK